MKAEACLVRSVKLEPSLVSGWNELGESYMRKHDWTTARTCFEVSNPSSSLNLFLQLKNDPKIELKNTQKILIFSHHIPFLPGLSCDRKQRRVSQSHYLSLTLSSAVLMFSGGPAAREEQGVPEESLHDTEAGPCWEQRGEDQ